MSAENNEVEGMLHQSAQQNSSRKATLGKKRYTQKTGVPGPRPGRSPGPAAPTEGMSLGRAEVHR